MFINRIDGANAHALLCFQVAKDLILPSRTRLSSAALGAESVVFGTDAQAPLFLHYDHLSISTWSNFHCCLPSGATDAYPWAIPPHV